MILFFRVHFMLCWLLNFAPTSSHTWHDPTLASTAGVLGHCLAVFFFSSVTRVYKRGNRLYLLLSRAFHMWILRMLLEYTCFTIPCQLLPSSSANQFCVYTYPTPGKPRWPSSHCPRSPPSTQPSPAPWATEQLPASSLFHTWWCMDVSATLSVHTQLTEIKPLALEGKRRAWQWCWGIASLERHKRDCNTCSLWGTRGAEKQNFHCIIYCIFRSFKFCAWQVLFFCATVQYMYKDIHRPTQTHTETYIGMKKSSAVYVGLTLQMDAGVSECGTLAACVAKSCFWPFSHSGWSTLRPHQLYPWMGAFLFHQKSGKSFYSYCLLGHAKRDKTGNWGKKKKKSMITPVFLPGKSHGQRSLAGWIARSWIQLSKHTHTHTHLWIWRTRRGLVVI